MTIQFFRTPRAAKQYRKEAVRELPMPQRRYFGGRMKIVPVIFTGEKPATLCGIRMHPHGGSPDPGLRGFVLKFSSVKDYKRCGLRRLGK